MRISGLARISPAAENFVQSQAFAGMMELRSKRGTENRDMFIRTERLFLRPGWPEDLDDLLEALSGEAIQRTAAPAPLPKTREGAHAYLDRPYDPRLPHFFMYLRSAPSAKLVGGIGLARRGGEVELSYWIAAAYRGRGYALEAVRAVVEHARVLGHRRLIVKPAEDEASTNVLEAAGFRGAPVERPQDERSGRALIASRRQPQIYVADLPRREWTAMRAREEMLSV